MQTTPLVADSIAGSIADSIITDPITIEVLQGEIARIRADSVSKLKRLDFDIANNLERIRSLNAAKLVNDLETRCLVADGMRLNERGLSLDIERQNVMLRQSTLETQLRQTEFKYGLGSF